MFSQVSYMCLLTLSGTYHYPPIRSI